MDGLITEIESLAWEILSLTPPERLLEKQKAPEVAMDQVSQKEKGGSGWLLWTTLGLAAAGGGVYYYLNLEPTPSALPEPPAMP